VIRHLFKMVWNRRRTNALIILEILFSFLVLFGVTTLGVYYLNLYHQPLGFAYENVWNLGVDMKVNENDEWTPEMVETARQVFLALQDFSEIEGFAGIRDRIFGDSTGTTLLGENQLSMVNGATDSLKDVMGLQLTHGRWFDRSDGGVNYDPVVINKRLQQAYFGSEDPLGKNIAHPKRERQQRVIGVVTDFRQHGELDSLSKFFFQRIGDPKDRPPQNIVIKVRPGTTASFEEKLVTRLQAVARNWSFEVQPLSVSRESKLRWGLAPLMAVGIVATFLLIMVALGLVGVLWQNVTQRTMELGLRRALGGTAGNVQRQVLGELFVTTTAGIALGSLLIVQMPLLGVIGDINEAVYIYSFVISLLVMYAITTLCGLYPSWLATKVQPATALHYE
jgi:putative ABC transport system permease protein